MADHSKLIEIHQNYTDWVDENKHRPISEFLDDEEFANNISMLMDLDFDDIMILLGMALEDNGKGIDLPDSTEPK